MKIIKNTIFFSLIFSLIFLGGCGCQKKDKPSKKEFKSQEEIIQDGNEILVSKEELKKEEEKLKEIKAEPLNETKLSMKEAFEKLKRDSGKSDLGFYLYQGFLIDDKGKTNKYIISGCVKGDNIITFQSSEEKKIEFGVIEKIPGVSSDCGSLDGFKDTPEIMKEASQQEVNCSKDARITVYPEKSKKAKIICKMNTEEEKAGLSDGKIVEVSSSK